MARAMKDSGIEWIGYIPQKWDIVAVKELFNIGRGRVIAKTELNDNEQYPVYSSQTKNNGCLGYISTYDFDKPQLTWTTDGANAGTVFLREGKYNCTNVCGTLLPKEEENNLMFLKYCLEYIAIYHKRADINGFKIMNNEMAQIRIVLPTVDAQQRISAYLDEKCKVIDSIIENTKATIEEYKKYKEALITEAVTKGLDTNVEMEDSEIEWIGEIPKHWEMVRIQRLYHTIDERNDNPNMTLLSLYTAIGVKPRSELEEKGNKPVTVMNYKIVRKGDLVVNKLLAWMGAISYSDYEGATSPDYDVYREIKGANVFREFYNYYFRFTNFKDDCYKYGHGIMLMRWRTYPSELLRILVPNPPYSEQQEIAEYINNKCTEIDNLISQKQQIITELQSYKKSLIYECVTGKVEV